MSAASAAPPINGKSHRPASALVNECYGHLLRYRRAVERAGERRAEVVPDEIAIISSPGGPEALMALLEGPDISALDRSLENAFLAPAATFVDVLAKLDWSTSSCGSTKTPTCCRYLTSGCPLSRPILSDW